MYTFIFELNLRIKYRIKMKWKQISYGTLADELLLKICNVANIPKRDGKECCLLLLIRILLLLLLEGAIVVAAAVAA